MKSFKKLLNFLWPLAKKYPFSFIWSYLGFGIGSALGQIVKPIFFKQIIDIITEAGTPSAELVKPILTIVLFILILQLVYNVFYRSGDYAISYFQSNTIREIQNALFKRLALHSHKFFANNFSGSLVAKAKRLTRSFEQIHDTTVWRFWGFLVSMGGVFGVLLYENTLLGLIFLGWACIYVMVTIWLIKKKMKYDLIDAAAESRVTGRLADVITNMFTVKSFGREDVEQDSYGDVTHQEEVARRKMWYFGNKALIVQGMLMLMLEVGGIYAAVELWLAGTISTGTVVLVQVYLATIFHRLWELGNSITRFVKAVSNCVEMIEIIEQPIDISDPQSPKKMSVSQGVISIQDATFSYGEQDDAVFRNFNLTISAGQKVGLVGISGSGKSTLIKLILRFADLDSGTITIDDQDITSVTQADLRDQIAFVPQEPLLFHRSIFENIQYGKLNATTEDIIQAAKQAHAHYFIEKLAKGYNTLVGERGIKLSGGERQRVAIARAILKDAPIVILDEATSSLDSVSEQYIQDALETLIEDKTTIVIAHRLSTIQRMDRILVMKEGAIVEDGTHEELLAKEGEYHNLWSHQKAGFLE